VGFWEESVARLYVISFLLFGICGFFGNYLILWKFKTSFDKLQKKSYSNFAKLLYQALI